MKKIILTMLLVLFLSITAFAEDATITWAASQAKTFEGYKVYKRTESGVYGDPVLIPKDTLPDINNPTYTTSIDSGANYFAVSVYGDVDGNILDSTLSKEVGKYGMVQGLRITITIEVP